MWWTAWRPPKKLRNRPAYDIVIPDSGFDGVPFDDEELTPGADEDIQSPLPLQDPVALPDDSYICQIAGYEDVSRRRTSKSPSLSNLCKFTRQDCSGRLFFQCNYCLKSVHGRIWVVVMADGLRLYFVIFIDILAILLDVWNKITVAYNTRQLSYRKEDRAMRPIYGYPEKFWESSLRPRLLFQKFVMDFCSDRY